MEKVKRCFKCGRELPLSEFYKHPAMGDGHLNKCKECTKFDVRTKYMENIKDPLYIEKQRERGREKYARLYSNGRGRRSDLEKEKRARYPWLRNGKQHISGEVPQGYELHHWNYNKKESLILLERKLHHRLHTEISLDIESGIYYFAGIPLDTIEKHLSFVYSVCSAYGFDYQKVKVYKQTA